MASYMYSASPPLMHQRWTWRASSHCFERVQLYADHVRLDSWSWRGIASRTIPLAEIGRIDIVQRGKLGRSRLRVGLHEGKRVRLAVASAFSWKTKIEQRIQAPAWQHASSFVFAGIPDQVAISTA